MHFKNLFVPEIKQFLGIKICLQLIFPPLSAVLVKVYAFVRIIFSSLAPIQDIMLMTPLNAALRRSCA